MEPLWSLVNLNQLLFFLPLLSLEFPKNTQILFQGLAFASGDMAAL